SDNLIFVKDIQGRYELVNKKWEATTGLNRLQVLGQIDSEVFPEGEGDRFRENDQLVFDTKSVVDVEEILGSGDSARYFQSLKFPLFDANGNMNLMCGMSRDITERRKMQQELKISEEKFKNIYYNTPAGLYRTAVDGKVVDVNPALLKMLGYSDLEHLQSKSVFDIYVDLEEKKRFDLQMESKGKFTGISQWYRSDGSIIWLEEQATAIKDENGVILYYDGSVINVTENKHAQDKLLDSELKYRTLFEGAGDAIMIMRGNCFIDCNAAAENMFVLSRDKIIKSTPVLLSPEKQRNGEASDVLAAKYTSMAINNSRYVFEWLHKRADDSVFDAEVSLQLVEIQGEKLLQAIVRDVTERKQLLESVSISEERYRLLFENITQGFALHEIICDENGLPIDYSFLSVNPAYEKLTGLKSENVIGKTVKQVIPELEAFWIETYGKVALTGEPVCFENYSAGLGKHFEVSAFSPGEGRFAVVFSDITDRIVAHEELQKSEERYRLIANNTADTITILDFEFNYLYSSPSVFRLLGYSVEEILTMKTTQIMHPDSIEIMMNLMHEEMENEISGKADPGRSRTVVLKEFHKNGSVLWVESTASFIRNEKGEPMQLLAISRDVTERIKAEELLQKAKEEFKAIFENNSAGIAIIHPDSSIVMVNNAYLEISGYSREEVVGESWTKHIHPDDLDRLIEYNNNRLENPTDISDKYELSFCRRNGEVRCVLMSVAVIPSSKMVVASFSDITERKNAEKAMIESEERYRAIFNNSVEGIYQTTPDGQYRTINSSFAEMFGYDSPEDMISCVSDIRTQLYLDPSDRDRFVEELNKFDGIVRDFETQMKRKDGSSFWVSINGRLMFSDNQESSYIEGTCINITERKLAEETVRLSAEKWQATFNSITDIITVISKEHVFLEINQAGCDALGMTHDEIIGKKCHELVHGTLHPIGNCPCVACINIEAGGVSQIFENGRYFQLTAWPIFDGNNELYAFSHSVKDITDQKLAEIALAASEDKFRNLAESSPFAIMIYQNTKWVYSNPAGEQISGYSLSELQQMYFWEFVHPDDMKMVKERGLLRESGNQTENSYEFRIVAKNGEMKWVYLTGTSINYQDKNAALISIADVSERKMAEEELRESRQLFASLADMSPVGIFRTDPEGATTYVNPKWCEMSGLTYDEALGDGWLNSLVPEDVQSIKEGWYRTVRKQTTSIAEYRFQHADGEIVWVYGKAIPEVIDGVLNGYIGTITDFTERKKAEIELLESRQLFESLSNMSPVGIFRTDAKGFTTYVNPKWVEITGLSEREAMGKQWYKAIHPDDFMQSIVGWDNAVLKEGESIAEFRFFHPDGEVRWVFGKAVPERRDGELVGYIGTITDITERKLFENTLIENEKNLKRAEMVAGFGNWAFDLNNNFVRVSEGASQIYGLEDRQYLIPEIQKISLPEYREALDRELGMLIAGEKDYDIEFEITRQSDNQRRLIHSIAEYDLQSNMIFGVIRDITEKKQMELALLNREKQEKELVERELAKTQDALVRSTRLAAVGQISATIAHDLRNPLGAVRNAAYYLKRKLSNVEPKVFNYFNIIDGEIETADKIISNLLQMAKVKEPEKVQNDFREVIALATGEQYAKLNIAITVQLDKEPFILQVDKVQIVQVVRNLLENSSHTGVDKVVVDIRGQHLEEEVELIFCDNGPGISQEVRDSLFEPLITTKAKGTGLGLTICKQIIEKHGGTISLVDKPEMGACFRIVLPLK
ncbi:MAG: hypothetical protein CVU11_11760, partial [Bacteroidetes bacterium HGW-Bacteroidetes-6]